MGKMRPGVALITPPDTLRRKVGPPRHDAQGLAAILAAMEKVLVDRRADYHRQAETEIAAIAFAATLPDLADRLPTLQASAHELRGMAGTFGLILTGRIADQLCRGLEQGTIADAGVIKLYAAALAASLQQTGPIDATAQAVLNGLRDLETRQRRR